MEVISSNTMELKELSGKLQNAVNHFKIQGEQNDSNN